MNPFIELLRAHSELLIMWGALLIHFILPIPKSAHPVTLWHKFAGILAEKVNSQHSYTQKEISGSLAWVLMIVPTLILLIAFKTLIWQPEFYDLALLLLALDWRGQVSLSTSLIHSLAKEDKQTARDTLALRLNRQINTLSIVGLGKAGAETLVIGQARHVISVLFWYGLLGGIGAFLFRLIAELNRAWSPAQPSFYPFGLTSARMMACGELIPASLFTGLLLAGKKMSFIWHQVRQQSTAWPSFGPGWLLSTVGNKFNLSLGGPALYEGKKSIRTKVGGRIVPSALHLSQVQRFLNHRTCIWVIGQSLITFLVLQGLK